MSITVKPAEIAKLIAVVVGTLTTAVAQGLVVGRGAALITLIAGVLTSFAMWYVKNAPSQPTPAPPAPSGAP